MCVFKLIFGILDGVRDCRKKCGLQPLMQPSRLRRLGCNPVAKMRLAGVVIPPATTRVLDLGSHSHGESQFYSFCGSRKAVSWLAPFLTPGWLLGQEDPGRFRRSWRRVGRPPRKGWCIAGVQAERLGRHAMIFSQLHIVDGCNCVRSRSGQNARHANRWPEFSRPVPSGLPHEWLAVVARRNKPR